MANFTVKDIRQGYLEKPCKKCKNCKQGMENICEKNQLFRITTKKPMADGLAEYTPCQRISQRHMIIEEKVLETNKLVKEILKKTKIIL